MTKNNKIKVLFSTLGLMITAFIIYKMRNLYYFKSIFFGIILFILETAIIWVINKKKMLKISRILNVLEHAYDNNESLPQKIKIDDDKNFYKIETLFNNFIDTIENIVTSVKENSINISKIAEKVFVDVFSVMKNIKKINKNINNVSNESEKISESINEITVAVGEIYEISQKNSEEVTEILNVVTNVKTYICESEETALNTKNEMQKIEELSLNNIGITEKLGEEAEKIGRIVDTIKVITNQTNLLALNATIEAARAGEYGKGFSVVADEIRSLAENNNQSAKMIESLIKNIQQIIIETIEVTTNTGNSIKQGNDMMQTIYNQLQYITNGITNIEARIKNISECIQEQSSSNEQLSSTMEIINKNNSDISFSIHEIAESIAAQSKTITELNLISSELSGSSEQLYSFINNFVISES